MYLTWRRGLRPSCPPSHAALCGLLSLCVVLLRSVGEFIQVECVLMCAASSTDLWNEGCSCDVPAEQMKSSLAKWNLQGFVVSFSHAESWKGDFFGTPLRCPCGPSFFIWFDFCFLGGIFCTFKRSLKCQSSPEDPVPLFWLYSQRIAAACELFALDTRTLPYRTVSFLVI